MPEGPARRLLRVAVAWAVLSDSVPLYSLYALLFANAGLSDVQISALFALWSGVGAVAEVPLGAFADHFSRRGALVIGGVLKAAGFALWTARASLPFFAAGFVLWGLAGALESGAAEALLYDGMAEAAATADYPRALGRLRAAGLFAQLPAAGAATVLFALGGFDLAGWVSVGICLASAVLAARLPRSPRRAADGATGPEDSGAAENAGDGAAAENAGAGYIATLRAGLVEVVARPEVRGAVLAVALLASLDTFEEYIPLLARNWSVPTVLVPVAVLGVPLAGAVGAAWGGVRARCGPVRLGVLLGVAMLVLGAAGVLRSPVGLVGTALCYGGYRLVLVVVDSTLQDRVDGPARATVTSVAALGTSLADFAVYGLWTIGHIAGIAALGLAMAVALPYLLRRRPRRGQVN